MLITTIGRFEDWKSTSLGINGSSNHVGGRLYSKDELLIPNDKTGSAVKSDELMEWLCT